MKEYFNSIFQKLTDLLSFKSLTRIERAFRDGRWIPAVFVHGI